MTKSIQENGIGFNPEKRKIPEVVDIDWLKQNRANITNAMQTPDQIWFHLTLKDMVDHPKDYFGLAAAPEYSSGSETRQFLAKKMFINSIREEIWEKAGNDLEQSKDLWKKENDMEEALKAVEDYFKQKVPNLETAKYITRRIRDYVWIRCQLKGLGNTLAQKGKEFRGISIGLLVPNADLSELVLTLRHFMKEQTAFDALGFLAVGKPMTINSPSIPEYLTEGDNVVGISFGLDGIKLIERSDSKKEPSHGTLVEILNEFIESIKADYLDRQKI